VLPGATAVCVGGEGQDVGRGLFEVVGHRGQFVLRASTIQSNRACTLAAWGWSYALYSSTFTHSQEVLGPITIRFAA
jgi:hypothetical protein